MRATGEPEEFEALLDYLKRSRGFDFGGYKRPSLTRRIARRMESVGINTYGEYIDYLEVHPEEFAHLFNTILINVTAFFRDPSAWQYLSAEVLPRIVNSKSEADSIRLWCAGCASGEEPYSLVMSLAELLGPERFLERVKVFATDADDDALNNARRASYRDKDLEAVPEPLRRKYFERVGDGWVFDKELRRAVIFGRHDLMQDAPISRVDLLACRNTMMYFNSEAQSRIMERFHFALNPGGYLFLGKAEMLFSRSPLFNVVDVKQRVCSKVPGATVRRDRLLMMAQSDGDGAFARAARADTSLQEAAFDVDPVAQLVIDSQGVLVLANERARALFGLGRDGVGRPIQDLELSYRPIELRSLIEKAYLEAKAVGQKEASFSTSEGDERYFDVMALPLLDGSSTPAGVKLTFVDVTRYKRLQQEIYQSHQALETAYEELQSTTEEKETTNEELQSSNEELETTNEELQSTNEELETMNEELQSTNEELQATNEELRDRSGQLNRAHSFLEAVLGGLINGVVSVDRDLRIQTWNHQSEDLWGLRADEVIGQHLLGLDIGLPVDRLKPLIRSTLAGEKGIQELTLDAVNRRGKAIRCKVVATPLRANGGDIDGVILLMEDRE